jgi:hypothetical protein
MPELEPQNDKLLADAPQLVKKSANKVKRKAAAHKKPPGRGRRRSSLFPASSFEEALTIPNAIQRHAAGQKVRRLTLFDSLKKSPDSGPSRQLTTNANKYGLIKGHYKFEHLELTADGKVATSAESPPKEKLAIRFKLAVDRIAPFKALYEGLRGNRLPAASVLEDSAMETRIPAKNASNFSS